MYTLQQTFDMVVNGLRSQGNFGLTKGDRENYSCRYRTPEGFKCAAGMLIPDDQYDPNMEAYTMRNDFMLNFISNLGHDVILVRELQDIHDSNGLISHYTPKQRFAHMEADWHRLAVDMGIVYTPAGATP